MEALKITEKIIRENAFEHKKQKPGLSANRPANNWAQEYKEVLHTAFVFEKVSVHHHRQTCNL